jgi:predicted house-cleaning NTP pyrophosphatase (Maf/HAM1 superfamily)
MAAALVTAVRGSITNVVGLPLAEVVALLRASGAAAPDYRRGQPA